MKKPTRTRTTIGLKTGTKAKLDKDKAPGQCYDGFLSQLIDLWEKTQGSGGNKPGRHSLS